MPWLKLSEALPLPVNIIIERKKMPAFLTDLRRPEPVLPSFEQESFQLSPNVQKKIAIMFFLLVSFLMIVPERLTAVAFDSDLAIGKGACIYISSGNPRKACLYGVTEDLSSAFSSTASVRKICSLLL